MVSGFHRGQLILVGALLIATVIFGLSFLLNSLMFAGAAGSDGSSTSIAQIETADVEIQHSLRRLAVRVNHASRNVTRAEVAGAIESNVSAFSRLYGEAKAAAGSATVTVSYDNATSTLGYRILQDTDDFFTDLSGTEDWNPVLGPGTVPDNPEARIGWFTANVNVGNSSTGVPFRVEAENTSGDEVTLELRRDGGNLSVESVYDPAGDPPTSTTTRCGATNGRALVDLYTGSAYTGTCEFTGIGALDGPASLRFENGERIEGRYEIVMNRSNPRIDPLSGTYRPCDGLAPAQATPCVAPVIWSANVTTVAQNDRVSYESAYNLTVYAGAS